MATTTAPEFRVVPLTSLHESPLNPRKLFDAAKLQELADSIRAHGVRTPLLVRQNAQGYEIASGHRRYRAARAAGVDQVPVVVQAMTDAEFIELLSIDNLQREDLTPLEEAEGYRLLMTKAGYSVERIAERIGKSDKYVYDRVKLLQLVPAARTLLTDGTITAGHAILLARLKPEDQKRALAFDEDDRRRGGLLESETVLEDLNSKAPLVAPVKAVSVRELEAWIADHVRFKPSEADPFLLPHTAAAVTTAVQTKKKVVEITHDSYIQDDAREGRTIRAGYWKRADGKQTSKTCERSVIGVIVVGPGQGDSFAVCVDRERCAVHWGKEIKAKAKRAADPQRKKARTSMADDQARRLREQAKQDRDRARCDAAVPGICAALAEKLKKVPAGANGPLGKVLIYRYDDEQADAHMKRGTSAEDLVRYLAYRRLTERPDIWRGLKDFTAACKPFGVNVQQHLANVDTAAKAAAEAKGAEAKPAAGATATKVSATKGKTKGPKK